MTCKPLRLTACAALAFVSAAALASSNDLGADRYPLAATLLRDRSYCMEKVCLGAGIAELRPMGVLYWQDGRLPSSGWNCSPGQNTAEAQLLLTDGRRLRLTFSKTQPEGGEERYRLTSLMMPIAARLSDLQVRYAAKEIADRWKLPEFKPGESWGGKTPDSLMTVMLAISSSKPYGQSSPLTEIAAIAMLPGEDKWMMSLPQCRAGLPKL